MPKSCLILYNAVASVGLSWRTAVWLRLHRSRDLRFSTNQTTPQHKFKIFDCLTVNFALGVTTVTRWRCGVTTFPGFLSFGCFVSCAVFVRLGILPFFRRFAAVFCGWEYTEYETITSSSLFLEFEKTVRSVIEPHNCFGFELLSVQECIQSV